MLSISSFSLHPKHTHIRSLSDFDSASSILWNFSTDSDKHLLSKMPFSTPWRRAKFPFSPGSSKGGRDRRSRFLLFLVRLRFSLWMGSCRTSSNVLFCCVVLFFSNLVPSALYVNYSFLFTFQAKTQVSMFIFNFLSPSKDIPISSIQSLSLLYF